jgi:hypothetical protein
LPLVHLRWWWYWILELTPEPFVVGSQAGIKTYVIAFISARSLPGSAVSDLVANVIEIARPSMLVLRFTAITLHAD